MKIVPIFPGITYAGFGSYGKKISEDTEHNYLPIGLMLLASCCKQAGHEVEAIDLRQCADWHDFRQRVFAANAQSFGISLMTMDYEIGCQRAGIIREIKPQAKIIAGGIHATICADEVAANSLFDSVVTGEGEISLPALPSDLA